MRIKNNVNKKIYSKLISSPYDINNTNNLLFNHDYVISSFVCPTEIHNYNDNKTEYKSSFVQRNTNDFRPKLFNKDKLFTFSNSKRNFPYTTKESAIKKFNNIDTEIKNEIFPKRLIKEMKGNSEYNNKNTNEFKNDFIKQKFLNKIKDGNYFFVQNKGEKKMNKINKYSNIIKYTEINTNKTISKDNNNFKCKYEIYKKKDNINNKNKIIFKNSCDEERKTINNLSIRSNVKSDIYKYNTIDNISNNYKKQLNITDNKYISTTKRENNIIKLNKLRINENKILKKNNEISELTLDERYLKSLTKKKTFIENNNYLKSNNIIYNKTINEEEQEKKESNSKSKSKNKKKVKKKYHPFFLESYNREKAKYIKNKKKILIRNDKKTNYSNLCIGKKFSDNNIIPETQKTKKGKNTLDNMINNKNKMEELKNNSKSNSKRIYKNRLLTGKTAISSISTINKNQITKKESDTNINNGYLNIKKGKIKKIKIKQINKIETNKKESNNSIYEIKNKNCKVINSSEDINFVLNESEYKIPVNSIKINNFGVNKPKENNLKYTLLKESEEDEENKNLNKSQIENIVIGKIESYKDILETDEINKNRKLRSKSLLGQDEKVQKQLIKTKKNKYFKKSLKKSENKKTGFINMHILDDKSSEIEDLDYMSNDDCDANNHLINLENDYEFEDMPTFENETKINGKGSLLPFCVSKISFCQYYDKEDGNYKIDINENFDTDIVSLEKINEELNKLNDKYDYKEHSILENNYDLKETKSKKNSNVNSSNNNNNTNTNSNNIIKSNSNDENKKVTNNNNNNQQKNKKSSQNNINIDDYIYQCLNNKTPLYNVDNKILPLNVNTNANTNINNNIIKKKINKSDNKNIKTNVMKTSKDINAINCKEKNENLKIISNHGNKEKCFIF